MQLQASFQLQALIVIATLPRVPGQDTVGWVPLQQLEITEHAPPSVAEQTGYAGAIGFHFSPSVPRDISDSDSVAAAATPRAPRAATDTHGTSPAQTTLPAWVVTTKNGEVDLLTDGGPQPEDSTTTITYFVYGQNSPIRNDAGLQAGGAVLLFLVLLVLSAIQLRGIGRRVHYAS